MNSFLDCVHCGLCTASCPTYVVTGNENDSPARPHLSDAIGHRRPAPAQRTGPRSPGTLPRLPSLRNGLPSGVQYGKLIEPFRIAMDQAYDGDRAPHDWFHKYVLFGLFPAS